jgi:predicted unusual protein kinase regulating ubiquinone biosynthesis (AarF/ABC1/UbiB family)
VPRRRTLLAAVGAAIGAAAGYYLLVKKAGEDKAKEKPAGPVTATTRAARTLSMARIGTSAGGSYAVHRARRALTADDTKRKELDAQFELRTAEQVASVLGNMKGALMKIGQMASYLDQGLPEPVRDALAQLQADAPPMSAALAAECVERELGQHPSTLFAEWDETPMAAASIGQVHRALLHDGRAVAVKVQYPGIDAAIKADLDNAGVLFQAIGLMFPGLDPAPMVTEIRDRVIEELDYRLEASNQQLFADYWRHHPFIHVPDVVADLSTGRVLTTELAHGVRFDEARTWPQEERNLAAEAIYRFVFNSLYRLHAFNGDPHPGNYLFEPGGRVTFLDFGLVKRYTPAELDLAIAMIKAMVLDRDMAEFRRAIDAAGILPIDAEFDEVDIKEYFSHFYSFVLEDEKVTITPEWSSESVRRFFDASGPHGEIMKKANVPPTFVIIQRINLGLFAVLGEFHATRNWRRIGEEIWPWVSGPPSTPLGEAEVKWRAEHHP